MNRLIALFVILSIATLSAQNPFLERDAPVRERPAIEESDTATESTNASEDDAPARRRRVVPRVPLLQTIIGWQRSLVRELNALSAQIRDGGSATALIIILVFAFIYGVLHAIGPGHGKTLVTSYFIAHPKAIIRDGIIMGVLISVMHTISAAGLVLVLYFVIQRSVLTAQADADVITRAISAGIISLMGLYLIIQAIRERFFHSHGHDHSHDGKHEHAHDGHSHEHKHDDAHHEHEHSHDNHAHTSHGHSHSHVLPIKNLQKRSMPVIALAIGIVPCPAATGMMLLALHERILGVGVLTVTMMGIGMAITVSTVGILTITMKNIIERLIKHNKAVEIFHSATEVGGAVLLFTLGVGLFLTLFL